MGIGDVRFERLVKEILYFNAKTKSSHQGPV